MVLSKDRPTAAWPITAGSQMLLDAGDYLVSFVGLDVCIGTTAGVRNLWAVVLH